jgi:hypothetical protein
MADHLELNVETLGKTLRKQASGFRHLASGTIDREFRGSLLELAQDYDRQAVTLERGGSPSAGNVTPTREATAMGTYRVRFFKMVSSHGKTVNVCQRSIDIRSAPSPDRAVQAAKQRFAHLENITEWFLHADYLEVDGLPDIALDQPQRER